MYNAVSANSPVNACSIGVADPPSKGYHIEAHFGGRCMAKSNVTTLVGGREFVVVVLIVFFFFRICSFFTLIFVSGGLFAFGMLRIVSSSRPTHQGHHSREWDPRAWNHRLVVHRE